MHATDMSRWTHDFDIFLLPNGFVSLRPVWQLGQPCTPLLSKCIQQPLIGLVASDVRRWETVVKEKGVP